MIKINDISFSYGKNKFIESLSLTLPDSSLTAIVGENGSGKTTLLSLISRELSQRSGNIEIDGSNTQEMKRDELARRLSVFPQGRETPDMTALELVTMGRYPYIKGKFTTPQKDVDIALASLARAGADSFESRRLSSLSYGERQRVYLAMLIAQDTQNLLLDEPTNYLDISAKYQTMELLTSLKNEGRCVVTVLHDITLALAYADRIAIMKDGSLAVFDTPEAIFEGKYLEKAFGIRITKFESDGRSVYLTEPK